MNVLTRWDPLQEVFDMRRAMDQIMQRTGTGADGQQQFEIAMDIYETPDSYEIEAAMPGIKPEDQMAKRNIDILKHCATQLLNDIFLHIPAFFD